MASKTIPPAQREKAQSAGQTAYGTSFPVRNADELRRAVQAYGRAPEAKRAALRRFLARRARQLGRTDLIPDEWTGRKLARGGSASMPHARPSKRKGKSGGWTAEKSIARYDRIESKRKDGKWDESKHPRKTKGQREGGRFTEKGSGSTGGSAGGSESKGGAKGQTSGGKGDSGTAEKAKGKTAEKPGKTARPGKTPAHGKAGLKRVNGNVYVNAEGYAFKRVGQGKGERFQPMTEAEVRVAKRARRAKPTQAKVAEIERWNRQPDEKRIAAMKRGEQPKKLPPGWIVHEDGSIAPGRKRKDSGKEGKYTRSQERARKRRR